VRNFLSEIEEKDELRVLEDRVFNIMFDPKQEEAGEYYVMTIFLICTLNQACPESEFRLAVNG
jgi:hypothetical protein